MAKNLSGKHIQIDKANQVVIAATAIAVVVVIFSLFVGRAMWMRQSHQAEVIKGKEVARDQLIKNIDAKDKIVAAYNEFIVSENNMIGGPSIYDPENDRSGDNARITLDALPSKYDFPAVATSIEKMLIENGYVIDSITGTDDEVAQSAVGALANPEPVEIPFAANIVDTNYEGVKQLIDQFERSIRPYNIRRIEVNAGEDSMEVLLEALTYYQPEKAVSITEKVVK